MNQSPKKRSEPAKKIGGGSLPLATASSPAAAVSSATPSNGGHPRNAPGKNEWKKVSLESVISILGDGLHGTPKYDDKGTFFFINGNNLRNGKIEIDENTKRTSENEYLKYKKNLNNRTLFVSINGTLGNIAAYNGEPVILGKSVCYFNVLESVDKGFIQYIILSEDFQKYINSLATGSTIKNVSLKLMRSYEFELPPFNIQRIISNILTSLDDKIALNHRINQTLEAMAQALFQSWFVDFDPVKAKQQILEAGGTARNAELAAMQIISGKNPHQLKTYQQTQPQQYAELEHTAKLFPNRLVESELGPVPEGWEVKSLSQCYDLIMGQSPPGTSYNESGDGSVFYQGRTDFGFRFPSNRIFTTAPTRFAQKLDTLASVRAPVGDVNMAIEECCLGRGLAAIRHKSKAYSFTFYQMLNLKSIFNSFESEGTVFGSINKVSFENIKIVGIPKSLIVQFEAKINSSDDQIYMNSLEIDLLTSTRDSLLPKLLSGEIDLSLFRNLEVK